AWTAVMEGERLHDLVAGPGPGRETSAGLGMVDPEAGALELGSPAAGGALARQILEGGLSEGERHHELADVVQEGGEVNGFAIDLRRPRARLRGARHGERVEVHLPAGDAARAGNPLEEA